MPAIRFKSFPLIEGGSWSFKKEEKNKIIDGGGFKSFKQAHTWFEKREGEGNTPERKGAYKLPHHWWRDGGLKTHRGGMIAAMGALLGARGGVKIPDSDRRPVYNHLAKHYAEFDLEPPEFKVLSAQEFTDHHVIVLGLSKKEVEVAFGDDEISGESKTHTLRSTKTMSSRRLDLKLALDTTSGAPLIPEDLEPVLVEFLRRLNPFMAMIPVVQAEGKTHEFNQRTALNQGFVEGESAVTPTGQNTYVRASVQLKIIRARGGVTGFQQAASRTFINSFTEEVMGATRGLAWAMEQLVFWGDAVADPFQYSGLDVALQSNRFNHGGGVITLTAVDQLIDSIWERGVNNPEQMALIMSPSMISAFGRILDNVRLPRETVEIEGGFQVGTYRGIPILRSTFTKPTITTGDPVVADSGTAGGLIAVTLYRWKLSAVTLTGEQIASANVTFTTGGGITSVDITVPVLAVDTPFLWKLWRTVAAGAVDTQVYVGSFAGRTYDGNGSVTGLVTTINDGVADAALGTDTPLLGTAGTEETVWCVWFEGSQSFNVPSLLNEEGETVGNLVQFLPLARVKDLEEFLVQSYQALAVKGEIFNSVLRNVRAA